MELNKLRALLDTEKITYLDKSIATENDGIDINYKNYAISVVSHRYSYGGDKRFIRNNGFIY